MAEKGKEEKVDWLARLGKQSKTSFGMFDILLASFFINVLSLVMPLALLQIYDRILPNNSMNTMAMLVAGIAAALLCESILRIGRTYLSGWVGARFEHMAGCAAIERILSTSVNEFEKDGSGVHLERISSLGTLKEFYAGQALMTLFDLPFAFIFLALISYLAGSLVIVPIILIAAFAFNAWRIGGVLRAALSERMVADERRFNFIIEVLSGIHTLKSMAMETQMLRRYERLQESCARTDYDVTRHSSAAMNLGALYSQVTMFAVVGFGSTFVIDAQLTVGGLAACTMLSGRAMQPLQRAVGIWARFQSIQLARGKMEEIFEMKPETEGVFPVIDASYRGEIELRNVGLRFEEDKPALFSNVNLKVEPGQIIGISGGNASGKSSLLYVMMGAMRTSEGQVLIDGQDINELEPTSVRRKIAYLPQHGVLFNGTILENLTMFKPELEEKALRIARLLGLDDVVARMPLGYDTTVGNGAYDSLPRGIKQRVAIARALMTDPVVLLFDEANAAMDSAGDKVLTEFLEQARGNRTLILVSHRPSLLRMADEVYDLQDGSFNKRDADDFAFKPPAPAQPAKPEEIAPAPQPVAQKKTAAPQPPKEAKPEAGVKDVQPQQSKPVQTQKLVRQIQKKATVQPKPQAVLKPKTVERGEKSEKVLTKEEGSNKKTPHSKVTVIPPKDHSLDPQEAPKFILKKRNSKKRKKKVTDLIDG
ncbi:Putative hlyB transporter, ATP-binding protein (modular protein) [Candidatus Terasakiella magnetica]|uniref:HlyB transporter, ATP-binding protein (Modular protein) n=1 Tax=Candidatus Terasakiella magnetica TaxID=1867952 RepID=A0A1C3RC42_9PROT|nr:ATP-binding cassette domain-containing protein [Candidatus Terasakiella magnetica]SCA54804.1 Putative hlyB transporter, ATP-binding protein (modular protein) [Candidatus Terasakiella magnetica]